MTSPPRAALQIPEAQSESGLQKQEEPPPCPSPSARSGPCSWARSRAAHRHERCLQPRQGAQAARPRQPPAHVQPRQHAVALGQLVPGGAGEVLAAVGARGQPEGRRHRVRRHARGLRCARRGEQTRNPGLRVRAFLDVLARLARLPRLYRRGEADVQAGAAAARPHPSRHGAQVALSLLPRRHHPGAADAPLPLDPTYSSRPHEQVPA